uniref:Uncharacterized protein n=1 Tax=Ciona savignyi TaxID=51511 RepID=H2ZIW9_CIOSA
MKTLLRFSNRNSTDEHKEEADSVKSYSFSKWPSSELRTSLPSLPLSRPAHAPLGRTASAGTKTEQTSERRKIWSPISGLLASTDGLKLWTPSPPRRRFGSRKKRKHRKSESIYHDVLPENIRKESDGGVLCEPCSQDEGGSKVS